MHQTTSILSEFFELPIKDVRLALQGTATETAYGSVYQAIAKNRARLLKDDGFKNPEAEEALLSKGKANWDANLPWHNGEILKNNYGDKLYDLFRLGLERAAWFLPDLSRRFHGKHNKVNYSHSHMEPRTTDHEHEMQFWRELSPEQLRAFASAPKKDQIGQRLFAYSGDISRRYYNDPGKMPKRWEIIRNASLAALKASTPEEIAKNLAETNHSPDSPWNFLTGAEGQVGSLDRSNWRWRFGPNDSFQWKRTAEGERIDKIKALMKAYKIPRAKAEAALKAMA